MNRQFIGIELREEQAKLNNERTAEISASYICDDGRNLDTHIKPNTMDMLFSCPPYYDLEVYSDKENDASNQETYEEFYQILDTAFTKAAVTLKDDRFAVIVAGDVRDKKGCYYDFCSDIKATFKKAGLSLYNELILLDPVGTAMLRASKQFNAGRKVCKVHQNVMVFYKGDTKNIKDNFPKVEVKEVLDE